MRKLFLILLLLIVIALIALSFMRSTTPVVIVPTITNIGQGTPVSVHVTDPHGIRAFTATIEQGGSSYPLFALAQPTREPDNTWNFVAGITTAPQLKDGKAQLIVEATSNSFLKKKTRVQREVTVVTHPPSVTADSDQHYLYLGMADLATLNVSGNYSEAGVRVGSQTFRAWPMPGGKPGMFSLYAFAWDMPPDTLPVVYAANGAGNDATAPLVVQFPKKEQPKYTQHELQIDDKFMQKVVSELDPSGSGDLVIRFLKINNEMRKSNNKTLSDLRSKTADHFLWSQPFLRQANAQTEATFADHRRYIYHGQKIDEQTHLGYDLAVTQHVGVQASNDGRVVYAAPLGIYGNCIVVDHGYGLQSIYGHLSHIDVKDGDTVKRGQVMGQSGMTGMAGGDHIHFTMQLDGVQIDPKNWWDPHWIKDHIARRVDLPGFTM